MHANIGIISGQNKPLIIIDGGLNSKYNTVISSVLGSDYTRHVITNSPYSIDKNQGYLT